MCSFVETGVIVTFDFFLTKHQLHAIFVSIYQLLVTLFFSVYHIVCSFVFSCYTTEMDVFYFDIKMSVLYIKLYTRR